MNPELQRNLWLEASPRRLAWAGLVVLLLYAAAVLINSQTPEPDLLAGLGSVGAFVFFAAALVWGVRLAGQSVSTEIGERTWEFQRLSALDPWSMTWGKLFGATSLAWATGLTGLVLATLAYAEAQGLGPALTFLTAAVALAVLLQSAGFAAALVGVRKARAEGRLATLRSAAGGAFSILFLLVAIGVGARIAEIFVSGGFAFEPAGEGRTVDFWGAEIERRVFAAASLVAFAAWGLVAGWRLMRLELQKRNGPFVWIGFLLFTAFWAAGQVSSEFSGEGSPMDPEGAQAAVRWLAAAMIFAGGVYAAAFAEPADRVRLRRFAHGLRRREAPAAWLTNMPAVIPALILAAVAFAGLIAQALAVSDVGITDDFSRTDAILFVKSLFVFILRDVAVIFFFRFGPRPKRGDFGAVLALFLLYGLGGVVAASLGAEAVSVILPSIEQPLVSLLSGLVQAGVVGALALRRIRGPERAAAAA
ncbi:MAG: hypothetical protein M3M95_03245 [Pseudomonadota bacterium]|nr:hypothetical protein [Pseudomonadota bacterium]